MATRTIHIVLVLHVVLFFITLTSSKELLKALYETDDPLLLDEEKSRQIADNLEKRKTAPSKVGSGKGRQQFFAQIGYNDDYYGNPPNKFDDTKSPIIENPQKAQRHKGTKTNHREPVIKQGQQNIVHTKDNAECPDDMPTYRTFEGSKCIPIHPNDQNTQTANKEETFIQTPEKPKEPSTSHHLINYLQLDHDHRHQHRYGYKHRHYKPKGQKNDLEPDRQIAIEKETGDTGRYKAGDTSHMTSGQKQEPITNQQTRPYWGNNVHNQQYGYQRESERQQNVYGQQSNVDNQQPGRYEQQTHRNNYQQPSQGQSQSQTQTDAQSGVIVDNANEVDSMDSYWSQDRGDQKAINPEISSRPEGSRNHQYGYQRESERQQNVHGQQSTLGNQQQTGQYGQETYENNYQQQSQSQTQTDAQLGLPVDYANEVDSMDSYWSQDRGDQKAINPEISSRPEGSRNHQYGYQRESERQQNVHGQQSTLGNQQQTGQYGQETYENNYQQQSQSQTQTDAQLGLPVDYANEVDSMDSYWSQDRGVQKPINPEISSRPEGSRPHQYGYQRESERQQNVHGQQSTLGNQQQSGQYGQETYENNYQQQSQSQTQTDAQLGLPVDYANEVDSMESYWSQDRGDQKPINPPFGSQNSRNPKQKIPTSVNTQKLSSHREQNTIDVDHQYQNQLYPIIGHRPWPFDNTIDQKPGQVPLDNTIDQQQVDTPLIPHYQKETLSCVGKDSGFYTDYASDCRRFYRCTHGDPRVFVFQCGPGTKFHSTLYQCMHEAQVDCKEQTYQLPVMK